jgi:ATP-dependent DNA helicase RecG
MNRLLSGDVGSGKTVVAAIALYNTALNGFQGVLMAPTEILASQHFEGVSKLLSTLPVALVTRTQRYVSDNGVVTKVTKKALHTMLAEGKIAVSIGTHALLTEAVHFKQLGLVIVDEQHRFGVMQRKIMKDKGAGAHFLSMTATPIPRSLALMLYGDLEVSIISELPPGRKKIITKVVEPAKREKAYGFIRDQVKAGRQVFVVCPLIEGVGQGAVEKKSVMMEYEKLSTTIFPDLKVGFLHGKLKPEEKEAVMERFEKNEIHILVSTSVIEVGVNIPNASSMMIEGADRFGLAQLHQFRGRVGRSSYQSYCLLFTDNTAKAVEERLQYFEAHHDGFALAEKDLEIRGPGQMYGVEQSGSMRLRLATLSDSEIVKQAREAARGIAPNLANYLPLQKMLHEVEQSLHLE